MVTTRKRSLGQGNVFTRVCHSVARGVGFPACITGHMTSIQGGLLPSMHHRSHDQGVLHPGGGVVHLGGSASKEGKMVCLHGGLYPGRGGSASRGWGSASMGRGSA